MSLGTVALLIGLFLAPMAILWLGHRLRRRPPAHRALFWGALIGYGAGAIAALVAGMLPPEEWSSGDTARGIIGFWALIIGPVAGALAATMKVRRG